MDELVRWLGEQIAEDERIARESVEQASVYLAGAESSSVSRWSVVERPTGTFVATSDQWERVTEVVPTYGGMHAEHIAAHDPARVLREIDAKRQLIALHEPSRNVGRDSDPDDPATYVDCCGWCQTTVVQDGDWPCETLRLLALPYSDRPGYREEWRP